MENPSEADVASSKTNGVRAKESAHTNGRGADPRRRSLTAVQDNEWKEETFNLDAVLPGEIEGVGEPESKNSAMALTLANLGAATGAAVRRVSSGSCPVSPSSIDGANHQKEWVQATWFASQEARRRGSDPQHSVDFAARRMSSLSDVVASANAVNKEPEVMAELVDFRRLAGSRFRRFRESGWLKGGDLLCSLFLVFGMDVYLLSSPKSDASDRIMHIVSAASLGWVAFLFVLEIVYNRSRSALPFLTLEFLSLVSFVIPLLWFSGRKAISSPEAMTRVTLLHFLVKAGKVVRLAIVAVRTHLSRLYRGVKSLYSGRRWAEVFDRGQHKYWESNTGSADQNNNSNKKSGSDTWQVSLQLHRHVEHQSVTLLFLFLLLFFGYEMLALGNEVTDVKHAVRVLSPLETSPHLPTVADAVFGALKTRGLDVIYFRLGNQHVTGRVDAMDQVRHCLPAVIHLKEERPRDEAVRSGTEEAKTVEVQVDLTQWTERHLIRSIYLSAVSVLVLGGATLMMHAILQYDVIIPIERMIELIGSLAHEPLAPLKRSKDKTNSTCETRMVENAIFRFAGLLQICFGEAGSCIIRDNMIDGVLQKNMCGKVMHGLFGFCDVRNFTTLTEVLQGDVVRVINGIADVVHTAVVNNFGAPNKNVGDAFLLVWKPKGEESVEHVAACALRSYITIIQDMQHSTILSALPGAEQATEALLRRLPDAKLRLGFGLHYGWAVECAIGSYRKIDASYLSPHVNFASRLEDATKQYAVDILVSSHAFRLLPPSVQCLCRVVDRVTFKGSAQALTRQLPRSRSRSTPTTCLLARSPRPSRGPALPTAQTPSPQCRLRCSRPPLSSRRSLSRTRQLPTRRSGACMRTRWASTSAGPTDRWLTGRRRGNAWKSVCDCGRATGRAGRS